MLPVKWVRLANLYSVRGLLGVPFFLCPCQAPPHAQEHKLPRPKDTSRAVNLSAADFAAACGLSVGAVRSMIARGELRAVRLGRAVRIPLSELTRLGLDAPTHLAGGAA